MATITIDGESHEIADGSEIMDACEDLGVPFGCRAGMCGSCVITITAGIENLTPPTQAELDMGLGPNQRLACQASIQSGSVSASY